MVIGMYVIDTNAFYYAAEISEFTYSKEKLQEFIRTHETIISTTSLFEFLIKHKDKIDIVQKGGKYLYQNNIKIASNVINPLPEHFIDDLANISQESLDVLCAEILKNKINVESMFTSVLFDMCLFSGYYFTALSDGTEPCEYCFGVLEATYRMFATIVLDAFKELYTPLGMRTVGVKYKENDGYIYPHLMVHFLKANLRQMGVTRASQKLAYNLVKETLLEIGKHTVGTVRYRYSEKNKKASGYEISAVTNAELIRAFEMLT